MSTILKSAPAAVANSSPLFRPDTVGLVTPVAVVFWNLPMKPFMKPASEMTEPWLQSRNMYGYFTLVPELGTNTREMLFEVNH